MAELAALQDRIMHAQVAQAVHGKRVIILFEGWVGSGKKDALKSLCTAIDPCRTGVFCTDNISSVGDDRHWFAPFWAALPAAGDTQLFFRSWYSRAVLGRVSGELNDKAWQRAIDEINEFENQQRDHGTVLVKLFFHVSPSEQQRRIQAQLADPWRRHLISSAEVDRVVRRREIDPVVTEIYDSTDTRWAPWTPIDAANREAAQIATLTRIATAMERDIPMKPPADMPEAEIVSLAERRRG